VEGAFRQEAAPVRQEAAVRGTRLATLIIGAAVLVAGLAGCGATPAPAGPGSPSPAPTTPPTGLPTPLSETKAETAPPVTGPLGRLTCPGDTWPPYDVPSELPGVSVQALDQYHLVILNNTGRDYSYRISGWEAAQLETCVGLAELEVERGPLAAGRRMETALGYLMGRPRVPVFVGIWDRPCGEACVADPIALLQLVRSPQEPPES